MLGDRHCSSQQTNISAVPVSRCMSAWHKAFKGPNGMSKKPRVLVCRESKDAGDKPDFIERAFGALFGSKTLGASEPFGMKRMSDEAYNEQSVATTAELAAPVQGDTEEMALIRPLLARTRLEKVPLRSEPLVALHAEGCKSHCLPFVLSSCQSWHDEQPAGCRASPHSIREMTGCRLIRPCANAD